MNYHPLRFQNNRLLVLDQKALPHRLRHKICRSAADAADAIRDMTVRGAPLIGQVAAWGLYLDLARCTKESSWVSIFEQAFNALAEARPTARNLRARLEILRQEYLNHSAPLARRLKLLRSFLDGQGREWKDITRRLGIHGASCLKEKGDVVTLCNTGRLATLGSGTAFAAIAEGYRRKKVSHVWACETRPYLQGMRLTMWELKQAHIPSTLITDSMAAYLMSRRPISAVFTGADRIAANGDTANKIGTLSLALAARHYGVPFYVVAPIETVDESLPNGGGIPIEERSAKEVVEIGGRLMAPRNTTAWNPAFDVTPKSLITGIITEDGVWRVNGKAF